MNETPASQRPDAKIVDESLYLTDVMIKQTEQCLIKHRFSRMGGRYNNLIHRMDEFEEAFRELETTLRNLGLIKQE